MKTYIKLFWWNGEFLPSLPFFDINPVSLTLSTSTGPFKKIFLSHGTGKRCNSDTFIVRIYGRADEFGGGMNQFCKEVFGAFFGIFKISRVAKFSGMGMELSYASNLKYNAISCWLAVFVYPMLSDKNNSKIFIHFSSQKCDTDKANSC